MRPYRKEKVASVVREIISDAIAHRMNDPRVAPLTTVSRVRVAGDLTVATVYLTIPGDEAEERRTMAAIHHAAGFLQRMLAGRLDIRQCPELRFKVDEAAKRARETIRLIEENRRNRPDSVDAADLQNAPSSEVSDDDDEFEQEEEQEDEEEGGS